MVDPAGREPAAANRTARFRRSRLRIAILAFVIRLGLRLLRATTRPVITGAAARLFEALGRGDRAVVAFCHGHLALVEIANPAPRMCVQVSRHTDGEIIARAVAPLGIRSARGSASRGGVSSLREMLRAFDDGYDLAVVVDGPRGPRQRVKPGVVRLAAATGAPLHAVAAAARHGWVARRSWDHFVIPFPFTKIFYAVGEPVRVSRDVSPEEVERVRAALEADLLALDERARGLARRGK